MAIPRLLDDFTERARAAAAADDPAKAIRAVLQDSLADADGMSAAIGAIDEDELLLFEDGTCSIWTCRFDPDVVFAPHEHRMSAHIAVYRGAEVEVMYKREPGRLRHGGNHVVRKGEVITLGPEAIHAITGEGEGQSHAIHVYQGPLTQVSRSLFDWTTGDAIEFTMENFHAMRRRKSEMDEFR